MAIDTIQVRRRGSPEVIGHVKVARPLIGVRLAIYPVGQRPIWMDAVYEYEAWRAEPAMRLVTDAPLEALRTAAGFVQSLTQTTATERGE